MPKPPECAATLFITWKLILVGHYGLQSVYIDMKHPVDMCTKVRLNPFSNM